LSKKKKQLSDDDFLSLLAAHKGNRSELAKDLGISPSAVAKRARRIERDLQQEAQDAGVSTGKAAVVVAAELMKESPGHRQGVIRASQDLRAINRLEALLQHIEDNIETVAGKLKESTRPNTTFMKTLTSLVREARGLITDSFAIKKDLFNIKATGDFIEAVVRVMEGYDPDVQRKLYEQLSRLGLEGQVTQRDAGET
jgi:DNA-binding Lrp family transcriptional regulator